jgi:hypothetical protein
MWPAPPPEDSSRNAHGGAGSWPRRTLSAPGSLRARERLFRRLAVLAGEFIDGLLPLSH